MGVFRQFPYSNFHEMNMDEIIKIVKTMNEEWNETKSEWASYKDFIDNYFANLDVSNEVLNAIRTLANSGELNTIIDPVIVSETTNWLAEHITVTEGATVIDDTLSIRGAGADAKITGTNIDILYADIMDIAPHSANLFNKNDIEYGYFGNNGVVVPYDTLIVSGFIPVRPGNYIKHIANKGNLGTSAQTIHTFNINKEYIETINGTEISDSWYTYGITSLDVAYIRFGNGNVNANEMYFGLGNVVVTPFPEYSRSISPNISINYEQITDAPITKSDNLINPASLTNGYLGGNGEVILYEEFRTTDFIPIKAYETYIIHKSIRNLGNAAKNIATYDSNKNFIANYSMTELSESGWYSFYSTNANVRFCKTTTNVDGVLHFYMAHRTTQPNFIPAYDKSYVNNNVFVDYDQIINNPSSDNVLSGKKWYVIGDSASHGDFSGIEQPVLDNGIYAGQLPVYPYYIGNRTGADVRNLAVNGATLATLANQPTRYQWTADNHYKNIEEDADIITIWLGANDMWQNVPIGNIDSTDASTFYGAYNTILSYYVNNFPFAKLGIVVSFWLSASYAEAVINVAKKYGVPVLNLYNDPSIPVTIGSQRPDVSSEVKTIRDTQWRVSVDNGHPSARYHEMESYYIEEWLKTL